MRAVQFVLHTGRIDYVRLTVDMVVYYKFRFLDSHIQVNQNVKLGNVIVHLKFTLRCPSIE